MKVIQTIMLVWGLCWSLELQAQVYNVTRYSPAEGLIQSQVRAIIQDHRRFLWLGTHGGISRFDGKKFENFVPGKYPIGDYITCLFQDSQDRIWMGSEQGLSYFDGKKFTFFQSGQGMMDNETLALTEDAEGNIWIGTEQGISIYDAEGKFSDLRLLSGSGEKDPAVRAFFRFQKNQCYVGTSQGLYRANMQDRNLQKTSWVPEGSQVYSLHLDRTGRLWIGTDKGIFVQAGDSVQHYHVGNSPLTHNLVYCLTEDKDGQIWIGTTHGAFRYMDDRFFAIQDAVTDLNFIIRSIGLDHEGNIWLGTDGGGLYKITRGVFRTFTVAQGMSSNIAKSFLEDNRGNIWISTYGQGITCFDSTGNKIATYTTEQGLGGDDISFSYKDRNGNLWFASYQNGLTQYSGNRFGKVLKRGSGLISDEVYCVTEAPSGDLWIGTQEGVSVYDGQRVIANYTQEDGLLDNTVYIIRSDSRGNIWLGTPSGISMYRRGKFQNFSQTQTTDSTYRLSSIIAIQEDAYGRIWFATSTGLFTYENQGFIPVRISGAQGAHNVVSLTLENDSLMWIGTENGAYRLNLKNFRPDQRARYEHFTQKDGLPSMECNGNAAFRDSRGNIWMGTTEGAIMYPAGTERLSAPTQPTIHITNIRLALQETNWEQRGYVVSLQSGLPENLSLSHSENRLVFEYVGISMKSPQQVEYKFRLEGLDEDWSSSTRQTSVSYANLPSGAYVFKVVAKNEADPWDYEHPAQFSFTIRKAYYETVGFWLVVACMLGIMGWNVYRYISAERRRKREEDRMKNQAEKLQLEHQALYAMMNPHFTFNALQSIQFFIHRQDRKSANKFLSSFAKLVRKNLESTKTDFISLQEEVDRLRLYLSLEQMRFPEKFDYKVYVDPEIDTHSTLLPPMILQPFVENSIKHGIMPLGSGGKIDIRVSAIDIDYLMVTIEDNGIGIETSRKQKENRPNDHVSKGMQITRDRLALFARMTGKKHEVKIAEIKQNGKVEGTQVEILLPAHQ